MQHTQPNAFRSLLLQAATLARAAATMDVPAHYKAQATAIANLASLKLTRVVGEADRNDAICMADDLRDISRFADSMIAAIGSHAASNFSRIDEKLFKDVLSDSIDGNALYELETAGERREQEIREECGAHRVAAE